MGYCSMRECFSNLHRVPNSIPSSVKQTEVYNNKLADKYKNFGRSFKMFFFNIRRVSKQIGIFPGF